MSGTPWWDNQTPPRPMLATAEAVPAEAGATARRELWIERKYDGIRTLAVVEPRRPANRNQATEPESGATVRLWSRNGIDKARQFPEICAALRELGARHGRALILDGEIVAISKSGEPLTFEALQPRMHLAQTRDIALRAREQPVALFAFDILRAGTEDLCALPLTRRRARLEEVLVGSALGTGEPLVLTQVLRGAQGAAWRAKARADGWEGVICKDADSPYLRGERSSAWRKWKLVTRQEFVVGGWTEVRGVGGGLGALLLGVHGDDGRLIYCANAGSGLGGKIAKVLLTRLGELDSKDCPFVTRPMTDQKAHWVLPKLCVEVQFSQWTKEGSLRHPVVLGIRDDVAAHEIKREPVAHQDDQKSEPRRRKASKGTAGVAVWAPDDGQNALLSMLSELEKDRRDGLLRLPDGGQLKVSNLNKIFWPDLGATKGDLLRHYVTVSPFILPVVADRPLVMRRFPDGIDGEAFYQHRAPSKLAAGVREAALPNDDVPTRLVGGNLLTLLSMAQWGSISQDPWFSRVVDPQFADFVALDLDPTEGVTFPMVNDVARVIGEILARHRIPGFPKTSGATGLHVYIPLEAGTPYEAGRLFAQLLAAMVVRKTPKIATIERTVGARGQTVYVDYLQNIEGKTLACAYSARASRYAGVSTPLSWAEVDAGVNPQDFSIKTITARLRDRGDLWAETRAPGVGVDLRAALDRLSAAASGPAPRPRRTRQ